MTSNIDRRQFAKLAGLGGVVFASGLGSPLTAGSAQAAGEDFYFVQLSDTHWGFKGAPNPEAADIVLRNRPIEALRHLSGVALGD